MTAKYGIFLGTGIPSPYGQLCDTREISKMIIEDFETLDEARDYIEKNGIRGNCFILQYWD